MKKTNNKGFSLVELIIVIAIMAILVGVLAPQYLKYVEKSRVSADMDQLDSVYTACTTAAADPELTDVPGNNASGTLSSGGSGTWTSEVCDTIGSTDGKLKWKSKRSGGSATSKPAGDKEPTWQTDAKGNFTLTIGDLSVSSKKQ